MSPCHVPSRSARATHRRRSKPRVPWSSNHSNAAIDDRVYPVTPLPPRTFRATTPDAPAGDQSLPPLMLWHEAEVSNGSAGPLHAVESDPNSTLSFMAEQTAAQIEEEQSPVGERSGMSPEGQLDADAQPRLSLLLKLRHSARGPRRLLLSHNAALAGVRLIGGRANERPSGRRLLLTWRCRRLGAAGRRTSRIPQKAQPEHCTIALPRGNSSPLGTASDACCSSATTVWRHRPDSRVTPRMRDGQSGHEPLAGGSQKAGTELRAGLRDQAVRLSTTRNSW